MITVHGLILGASQVGIRDDCLYEATQPLLGRSRVYYLENYFANLMFGSRAHIDVTMCDIYGIRILFSVPMLWDSALLSLLVSFINSDFRFSYLLPSGEHCIPDDRLIHLKIPKITLR